jgi:DNA-binding response OmpR family regulator
MAGTLMSSDASGSGPRLLVVDDNEDNRYTLILHLEIEGYRDVTIANDGEAALALLRTRDFDLVLLDVMMPKVDGYEVLARLKAEGRLHNIPVIMISALNEVDSVVRCIEFGAVDYLSKPFNPVLLRARVTASLEKKRLFNELRQRTNDLSESLQQQTATADVLKVISRSAFDLQTVLNTLVEAAARLCDADQGTIAQQQGNAFIHAAAHGFSEEFTELVKDLPFEAERGSATGRALLEGSTVHIPDVQADADYTFSEAKRLGGFRTILAVPMLREGNAIGVLVLTRTEVKPFTEKQIGLVSTFADQAAIAIENVRLFRSVEARTRELAISLEELRTAQNRLVQTEKLASLGQLTAGIAHEIKNPLNFVNNFSAISVELIDELREALGGVPLDDKLRAEINEIENMLQGNLNKVVQHGKRADSIVKNMLLHSRQGSGGASAGRYQRHRRGEPQSRLPRRTGREAGLQHHFGEVV